MISGLKNKYNFELRLATNNEIEILAEFLAKKNWEDGQKSKYSITPKALTPEAINFIQHNKNIILELIQGKVLVQDYNKFQVSIFVYNYVKEYEKHTVMTGTFRVLKTKSGMEHLTNEDVIFKLQDLKKGTYHKKTRKKVGLIDQKANHCKKP